MKKTTIENVLSLFKDNKLIIIHRVPKTVLSEKYLEVNWVAENKK